MLKLMLIFPKNSPCVIVHSQTSVIKSSRRKIPHEKFFPTLQRLSIHFFPRSLTHSKTKVQGTRFNEKPLKNVYKNMPGMLKIQWHLSRQAWRIEFPKNMLIPSKLGNLFLIDAYYSAYKCSTRSNVHG